MEKIQIIKLHSGQLILFKELLRLFERVFEMEKVILPDDLHLAMLLQQKSFHVLVAVSNGKIIGGLTAYTLIQYFSISPLLYIFDLAVDSSWQRKGIGTQLMEALKAEGIHLGIEEIFVQADTVDGHALEFYRSAGGIEEDVRHFNYPLKSRS